MISLSPNECRVLGTLVEKAQTTPAQYPLTLNALTAGCNQKNNRDPITNLSEEDVFDAIDAMRVKGLVREAMLSGSRVSKFRHVAREVLAVSTEELVLLAELMLRGPQSSGELRGHASRMHPLESLESVQAVLEGLKARQEPYVREIAARPGERASRFVQLFCPELHPIDTPVGAVRSPQPNESRPDVAPIEPRIARLEAQMKALQDTVTRLATALGESGPGLST